MNSDTTNKQQRLINRQGELTVFNDNHTFMLDEGMFTVLYNMWGELTTSVDVIQNDMVADEKYDSAIVCFVCRSVLDYCCNIIKTNAFQKQITIPARAVLTIDVEPVVNIEYFNDPVRLKVLNAFFIMLTRNMVAMNTDAKSKIIDYTYLIKHKLTYK